MHQPSLFSREELADIIPEEDKEAIAMVREQFLGFRCSKRMAPQTRQWPEALKAAAVNAIGGGATDSVAMSDKLFHREITCVKEMNEALAAVGHLCKDRKHTLPHPQPGVRLVRKGQEAELRETITAAASRITSCAIRMNEDRRIIKTEMKARLKQRYEQYASVYDMDFSQLYVVEFKFVNIEVPSYLKHNEELYREAMTQAMLEAREVVEITKLEMTKNMFEAVDHIVERLEKRRLVDGVHHVVEVTQKGGVYRVTYNERKDGKSTGKVETVEMNEAQFAVRVTNDKTRKTFTEGTAAKLFEELDIVEHQLRANRIGGGEMTKAFNKLRRVIGQYDRKSLPASLRNSEDLRAHVKSELSKVGESLLKLQVVKGERDIIRSRAVSVALNPDLV